MRFILTPLNGAAVHVGDDARTVKVTVESQDPGANRLTAVLALLGSDTMTVTLVAPLDRVTPDWILRQLQTLALQDGGRYELEG